MDIDAAERIAINAVRTAFAELRAALPTEDDAPEPDVWLSEREAAELAGLTADGMKHHRHRFTSPEVSRQDGRFGYMKSAVIRWVERRRRAGIGTRTGLDAVPDDGGEA